MSLSNLASIAVVLQGFLFIFSLGLVWYQVRENTRLVKAANTHKLVELSVPFALQLAQDRALTELWRKGMQNIEELDDIDKERYFNLLIWWLMLHESIYHQWKKRLIDKDTFASWTRDLEYFARRQQLGNHWPQLHTYFEVSFAEHVSAIIEQSPQEDR
jgi:hypothetical protein